jgi:hypothetical protein
MCDYLGCFDTERFAVRDVRTGKFDGLSFIVIHAFEGTGRDGNSFLEAEHTV